MHENISIGTFGLIHNKQMFIISDPDCIIIRTESFLLVYYVYYTVNVTTHLMWTFLDGNFSLAFLVFYTNESR